MNKVWTDLGIAPWEAMIDFFVSERGIDPAKAKTFVTMYWMWHGDFRPLLAAIKQGAVNQDVLNHLGVMLIEGRLKLDRRRKGRPKNPEANIRDILAAKAYEHSAPNWDGGSDELFEYIADRLGMSVENVRQAVTSWRKAQLRCQRT
jgi:hypothetical protein